MWASRAVHESRQHTENSFVTLTYSDENLPKNQSVARRPIQIFFKNLRNSIYKINPGKTIKYIACGEYSPEKTRPVGEFNPDYFHGEGQRPHYHALIFNHAFSDQTLWSTRKDINIYHSDTLTDIWGEGFCTVGELNYQSAAYVARYSLKKINGDLALKPNERTGLNPYQRICHYTGNIIDVEKERFHMSNGIGGEHFNQYKSDIYPADHVIINGYETRPPRYYDNLYDAENPESMESIKEKRILSMSKHAADNTPARRREREEVKLAQLNKLIRDKIC